MNANAKLWLDALRSGEYEQGEGALHALAAGECPDQFCCLGVACKVFDDANPGVLIISPSATSRHLKYDSELGFLPERVIEWLGLAEGNSNGMYYMSPEERAAEEYMSLINLNDTGASFEEIADVIESEPIGMFA